MNDADIDLINKTFYPGWLMVSQLRSGQEVKDGEALYRRACRWVNAARESLNKAGFLNNREQRRAVACPELIKRESHGKSSHPVTPF